MNSTAVEERIKVTFDAQALMRKDLIKKILMKRIRVAIDTTKFRGHADIIDNLCRDEIDNLPLTELDSDQDPVCFSMVLSEVN